MTFLPSRAWGNLFTSIRMSRAAKWHHLVAREKDKEGALLSWGARSMQDSLGRTWGKVFGSST